MDKLNKEESHFNKELSQLNRKLKDSKQDRERTKYCGWCFS